DDVRAELIEQGDYLFLGFEHATNVRVVQRPESLRLQDLANDAAILDGQVQPVPVEVGTNSRACHTGWDGHRGDHGPIQAERHLDLGESLGPLYFFGDLDRLVESGVEEAEGRREPVAANPVEIFLCAHAVRYVCFNRFEADLGEVSERFVEHRP